jgi:hypothetical protein
MSLRKSPQLTPQLLAAAHSARDGLLGFLESREGTGPAAHRLRKARTVAVKIH